MCQASRSINSDWDTSISIHMALSKETHVCQLLTKGREIHSTMTNEGCREGWSTGAHDEICHNLCHRKPRPKGQQPDSNQVQKSCYSSKFPNLSHSTNWSLLNQKADEIFKKGCYDTWVYCISLLQRDLPSFPRMNCSANVSHSPSSSVFLSNGPMIEVAVMVQWTLHGLDNMSLLSKTHLVQQLQVPGFPVTVTDLG